jgi:hypothetical protein
LKKKKKYVVTSRDQNAGRSHSIKIDNSFFERVEEIRYLGTNLTNQNSIHEENKCRLKAQNACYHSVQNLLSSSLLSTTSNYYAEFRNSLPVLVQLLSQASKATNFHNCSSSVSTRPCPISSNAPLLSGEGRSSDVTSLLSLGSTEHL